MSGEEFSSNGKGHGEKHKQSQKIGTWKETILKAVTQNRIYLLVAAHLAIFVAAYEIAFQLRFDLTVPLDMRAVLRATILWVVPVKLIVFHRFGSLHGWWRHVTFADLTAMFRASTLSTLLIAFLDYFLFTQYQIPRAVILVDWGATIMLLGGLRSVTRFIQEHLWHALRRDRRRPAFVVVADRGAEELVRQIHKSRQLPYRVIGYLDKNSANRGGQLGGIPFLGAPEHAVALAAYHGVRDVLVMAGSISGKQLRRLVEWCQQGEINLKMVPSLDHVLNGSYVPRVRDIDIHDLLRRDQVDLDSALVKKLLRGRRVLVTGAGGSIGSELCRQILHGSPECVILVERHENSLYAVDLELKANANKSIRIIPCVADILDEPRMDTIFQDHQPDIVFHAAAHKHVPLMEANAAEAMKNNVMGTKKLCELADLHGVERFVFVSTDKAVNPTSIMGVAKQLAERVVRAVAVGSDVKFVVVRFGNVLASAGSVVPLFQQQLRNGGPITVTHPEMRRFFMTIAEASQLLLQAAAIGEGGEVFVLDMGQQIKILDVAKDLVRLCGMSEEDVEIAITGVRPGEKLYEELTFEHERLEESAHPKLRVAHSELESKSDVEQLLSELFAALQLPNDLLRVELQRLVPNYCPMGKKGPPEFDGTASALAAGRRNGDGSSTDRQVRAATKNLAIGADRRNQIISVGVDKS